MLVCLKETHTKNTYVKNVWAELRGPNTRMLKVCFGRFKLNLKQTDLQKSKNWIRPENNKTENHEKQRLATLKRLKSQRLKPGDDNEFDRNLRLEKVVSRKVLKLAVETEEDRRARLENDAATTRHRLAMETDEERKQDWRRW